MSKLTFREANPSDVNTVLKIVNGAYRTEGGWTTESHLVVGDRLVAEDYQANLSQPNSLLLIASYQDQDVASILIRHEQQTAHFSMLAVDPAQQGKGFASALLNHAEALAKLRFAATQVEIHVLDVRKELLAFYERRGYVKADEYLPFPIGLNVGKPITQNLMLEVLIKPLSE